MRPWSYRLTVLGSAVAWLLVGLHLPTLHELADHGWAAPAPVRAVTALLALAGSGLLWTLLRTPPRKAARSGHDATVT